jgi:hypothetical protein
MRLTRLLLGASGIVLVVVGLWHLAGTSVPALVDIVVFLAGGVVAHDAVVAPLVIVGALVVARLPAWSRPPVVVGLVVLLSVTLMALPAISRLGARPDVPSLLNRPYAVLWVGFALTVVVLVAAASLLRRRTFHRPRTPAPRTPAPRTPG